MLVRLFQCIEPIWKHRETIPKAFISWPSVDGSGNQQWRKLEPWSSRHLPFRKKKTKASFCSTVVVLIFFSLWILVLSSLLISVSHSNHLVNWEKLGSHLGSSLPFSLSLMTSWFCLQNIPTFVNCCFLIHTSTVNCVLTWLWLPLLSSFSSSPHSQSGFLKVTLFIHLLKPFSGFPIVPKISNSFLYLKDFALCGSCLLLRFHLMPLPML